MDANDKIESLLEKIAARFPKQEIWQNIKTEYHHSLEIDKINCNPDGKCICCGFRQTDKNSMLCEECGKLYRSETSRVIDGYCDCGHIPAGETIYIYRDTGSDVTFCGDACVCKHYKELFGFFMRKSS